MTSKSGDQSKRTDNGEVPAIVPVVSTISGIGVPAGASKSPWGNTFRDRKKFFEKAVLKDEDTSGDQDDIASLSVSCIDYNIRLIIDVHCIYMYMCTCTCMCTCMARSEERV